MKTATMPLISTITLSEMPPARVLQCILRTTGNRSFTFVFNVTDKCQPTGKADRDVFRDIMADSRDLAIQGAKLSVKQHVANVGQLHAAIKQLSVVVFADKSTDVPNLRLLFQSAGYEWPLPDWAPALDLSTIRHYNRNNDNA